MSQQDAWQYIRNNWNCKNWTAIPDEVKKALSLDSRLGFCGGMLVTRNGSKGMEEFINRMNKRSNQS